ncbi:MAG TPA: membrane-bound lytic murein transglycosylase MltF [Burkholderiales bacterium]|nr:membrane-bound lytic murein transglycosylase MltF [Burkholderiales bacterium]
MPKRKAGLPRQIRSWTTTAATAILIAVPAIDPGTLISRPLLPPALTGELVVISRSAPTTRFIGPDGTHAGFEQDMLELFAKETNLRLNVIESSRFSDIIPSVSSRVAHLAAAGLSVTENREERVDFGPKYMTVRKAVAYNTDNRRPRKLQSLIGQRGGVLRGSSSAARLRTEAKQLPGLKWKEFNAPDVDQLFDRLAEGKLDYVVADSHVIELSRNFYPNVSLAFSFGEPERIAWAFAKDADPQLVNQVNQFFESIERDGTLRILIDRYFGHIKRLNRLDIIAFLSRRETVLPRYAPTFKQAQELTGIDWRLLAALGFQESHWRPLATSPTGVRGLMMLTSATADDLGVKNRLDPHESILAAGRYLLSLKERLPDEVPEPDRTWMALASYNVGLGHVRDARVLARRHKLNPNSWINVRKMLPLIARSEYYTTLKYGFARGGEAVILTENVRNFYDILKRHEQPHTMSLNRLAADDTQLR